MSDLRQALRNLLGRPGFTLVAVATLAIGIGANTAIFSVIDAALLRPLPFRNPEQLVSLYETESAPGHYPFAGPDFADWKQQNRSFQDMTVYGWPGDMNLSGQGRPDHVQGLGTAANFFQLLGVRPLLGRTWAPGEDQAGKNEVAVLSYGLWKGRFAGDPAIVGKTIELNSRKHTIVGVMPSQFQFAPKAQLWIPLDLSPKGLGQRGNHWLNAIGRLKPGVSPKAAQAELSAIAAALEKRYPDSNYKIGAVVVPRHEDLIGDSRDSLFMMLAAVGLVLLIACANVANLLLSRAVARQKEMAIRSALGAGRLRLVRQLLTESLLLAVGGGLLGLVLGGVLIHAFARMDSLEQFRLNTVQLDPKVLAFTFALSIATGVLFGIYPAFRTSRPDVHDELKGGAGSSVSPGRSRRATSNALVVCEFALSVMLLASAGLLMKDFVRLRTLDIGVRAGGVWTGSVHLPEANYATEVQAEAFARSLVERCRQIPGVDSASVSDRLPLEGGSNYYIQVRGQVSAPMSGPLVERHTATPEYFRGLGIRLLKGRNFTPEDTRTVMELVRRYRESQEKGVQIPAAETNAMIIPVVINQVMAETFWPKRDAVGQMFGQGPNGPWHQVIGVVSDVRQRGIANRPVPEAYDTFYGENRFTLVLHTSLPPASLTEQVRHRLQQLDSRLPLIGVRTMDEVIADHVQGQRFLSLLVGSFAALAALLAAIGIYGVLSYLVTQRTREIGIRMALGASRGRVLGEVLRQGGRLAFWGFAAGLAGAVAAGRVLASLLHEVKPRDPGVLVITAVLVAAVAAAACYVPARRAARLDPMRALRYE